MSVSELPRATALRSPESQSVTVMTSGGVSLSWTQFLALGVAHVALALAARSVPDIARLHGAATLFIGVAATIRSPRAAFWASAYIAGSEVLWRMTRGVIYWEFGKYAICLLMAVHLLRWGQRNSRWMTGVAYLALMMPAVLVSVDRAGLTNFTRDMVSFNLSGPAALAAVLTGAAASRERGLLPGVFVAMLLPILGILGLAFVSTATATSLEFTTEANVTTSGGYGPNQVSTILGVGALVAVMAGSLNRQWSRRGVFFLIAVAMLLQGIATFSRGGVYAVLIALGLLALHAVWRPTHGQGYLLVVVIALTLAGTWVVPRLNAWTGGALAARYTEFDLSIRGQLASEDLELFRENPVFGVGVGMAAVSRSDPRLIGIEPHTEFTRLLAEHGIFGVAALLVLALVTAGRYLEVSDVTSRAWIAASVGWCTVNMTTAAMRLAVVPLMLGLVLMQLDARASKSHQTDPETPEPEPDA